MKNYTIEVFQPPFPSKLQIRVHSGSLKGNEDFLSPCMIQLFWRIGETKEAVKEAFIAELFKAARFIEKHKEAV